MSERADRLKRVDWILFSLYLALIGLGWSMIYVVSYGEQSSPDFNGFFSTLAGKQTIWVGISLLTFAITFLIDWKVWQTFAYLIYGLGIVLLILVLFLGTEIKGATAWFKFGGATFQPSELVKFATCLALSSFMNTYSTDLKKLSSLFVTFAMIFTPIVLVLLQPDAGSGLVFLSFFILLYREGLSPIYLLVGAVAATILLFSLASDSSSTVILGLITVACLVLYAQFDTRFYWLVWGLFVASASFYFLANNAGNDWWKFILLSNSLIFIVLAFVHSLNKKGQLVMLVTVFLLLGIALSFSTNYAFNNFLQAHQRERIYMWLRPDKCDPSGPLYNVIQSKKAISSGGFQGKGLFEGTITKLNYVPEQSSDFIFCVLAEEQGFIGSFILMLLFSALIIRIIIIAERQRSNFSRYYAYGVAGVLFVHIFINIGMTMGVMPIIGIPLPFISKGGSSLLGFSIMIAVLLKLDSHRYSI